MISWKRIRTKILKNIWWNFKEIPWTISRGILGEVSGGSSRGNSVENFRAISEKKKHSGCSKRTFKRNSWKIFQGNPGSIFEINPKKILKGDFKLFLGLTLDNLGENSKENYELRNPWKNSWIISQRNLQGRSWQSFVSIF